MGCSTPSHTERYLFYSLLQLLFPPVSLIPHLPLSLSISISLPLSLSHQGSSINWMMQNFMGEAEFTAGLKTYINKFKWGNAEMVDLFEALNTAVDTKVMNVTEIMLTWTQQMGFPCLSVKIEGTKMTVTQDRYNE